MSKMASRVQVGPSGAGLARDLFSELAAGFKLAHQI
jgi:hypothetical protein